MTNEQAQHIHKTADHLRGCEGIVEEGMRNCLVGLDKEGEVTSEMVDDMRHATELSQLVLDISSIRHRLLELVKTS